MGANAPRSLLNVVTWLCIAPAITQAVASSYPFSNAPLRFRHDGTFKIVQFTDLHFGQDEMDDNKTLQVMRAVLAQEQDVGLVVFSGDMLSGWMGYNVNGWVRSKWPKVFSVVHDLQQPYAIILGNHDPQADLTRQEIVQLDMEQPLSMTRLGPSTLPGASNYWLSVLSSKGDSQEALRLWMLDSEPVKCARLRRMGRGCCERSTPHWLYKHAANASRVPALAFVHIPFPEYMHLWNEADTYGSKQEGACCSTQSHCLFEGLRRAGVTAVYCGHDHNNNYYGTFKGVRLGYGHKTGYSSYGPPPSWQRGARVLLLREGQAPGDAVTWIRLEDGTTLQQTPSTSKFWHRQYICKT